MRSGSSLLIIGAILILVGLATWIVPTFTTHQEKDVAKIGDLSLKAKESESHTVPPLLSIGALGVGVVLVVAGMRSRA